MVLSVSKKFIEECKLNATIDAYYKILDQGWEVLKMF